MITTWMQMNTRSELQVTQGLALSFQFLANCLLCDSQQQRVKAEIAFIYHKPLKFKLRYSPIQIHI